MPADNATIILKTKGDIKVKEGDRVTPETVLAEEEYTPEIISLNLSKFFSLSPKKCLKILKKELGNEIKENEVIAQKKTLFGLKRKILKSPVQGVLEKIDEASGELLISLPKIKKQIKFPLKGKVKKIEKGEITLIVSGEEVKLKEATGNFCLGEILFIKDDYVDIFSLDKNCANKIVVGKIWDDSALEKAVGLEALAIIAVEIKDGDLDFFKKKKTPLVFAEKQDVSYNLGILDKENFEIVKKAQGKKAAIFPKEKKMIILS